jgi:2-oxoglutarate dehydrogenase E2 component (dihydrolipoamide succinyltransferase)
MATEVVMPQMGESIAEGTIVRWMKSVGDTVERDEPLFEISTDKVDAEIPSPAAGVVAEIRAKEGETVPVNTVVAVIGSQARQPEKADRPAPAAAQPSSPTPSTSPVAAPAATSAAAGRQSGEAPPRHAPAQDPAADVRQRSSPLVRKIAKEHNVDISQIHGSGLGGRVTKDDILAFVGGAGAAATRSTPRPSAAEVTSPAKTLQAARVEPSAARPAPTSAASGAGLAGQTVPMSVMRRKIAEHMVASRRTSAHVHSAFEVNFSRVAQIREAKKTEFERAGAKLTYLSFIIKAVADALRAVPVVNASVEGDSIVYHKEVNIGVAVALDWGLIVPVIKDADEKNLLGLSRAVADLAGRARAKQLKPDDVAGGTFTITNPGVFGALFGMPIINQPQVAILGVGAIEKRPIVVDDAIAIRPMGHLVIGYDHRIIDGAIADEFMAQVKHAIENWDPSAV